MAFSKIQIYNLTLNHLGLNGNIQSADQTDSTVLTLNLFYDVAVEQVLKDFDWNFANTCVELTPTQSGVSLNPLYRYEFEYPNDCVCARKISLTGLPEEKIDFKPSTDRNNARVILSNVQGGMLEYTRMVTNENYFTAEFVMAISIYLASLVAEGITGQTAKRDKLVQLYTVTINKAITANATEGYENAETEPDWLRARN